MYIFFSLYILGALRLRVREVFTSLTQADTHTMRGKKRIRCVYLRFARPSFAFRDERE